MMGQIYKIIFDTNILWLDNENKISSLVNYSIKDSVKFVKDNNINKNVFLAIPEIVFQERIEQILEQVEEVIKKIQNGIKALEPFGVKVSEKSYKKNFRSKIVKSFERLLKDSKIGILITPKYNQKKLIGRALQKKKPFSGKGDKGLKDTLIWFTILDDAKKNKNINYVLCTSNEIDFDSKELIEEFIKVNNKSFKIVNNLGDLKQFLDNELDLKLKLKELYAKTENEIRQKIGEIMVQFHNIQLPQKEGGPLSLLNRPFRDQYYMTQSAMTIAAWGEKAEVLGYDFIDIKLSNIDELKSGYYEIEANLIVEPKYKNVPREFGAYSFGGGIDDYEKIKKTESHDISFYYDQTKKSIIFKQKKNTWDF